MKILYILLFFFTAQVGIAQDFEGTYHKKSEVGNEGFIDYELVLNADFTYKIKIHRDLKTNNVKEDFFEGTGTWKLEDQKITFIADKSTNPNDINLSGASARFSKKNQNALVFFKLKSNWSLNVGMEKKG